MSFRPLLLSAALALSGPAVYALGIEYGYDSFETPDAVTWVQTCGTWGGKGRPGTYRVVHAERFAQSFLYVQWMTRDSYGALQAVQTVPISELDNDHADISLSDLRCRATLRGIVVTGRADSGHDDKMRRVSIEVGADPGHYRYRVFSR